MAVGDATSDDRDDDDDEEVDGRATELTEISVAIEGPCKLTGGICELEQTLVDEEFEVLFEAVQTTLTSDVGGIEED